MAPYADAAVNEDADDARHDYSRRRLRGRARPAPGPRPRRRSLDAGLQPGHRPRGRSRALRRARRARPGRGRSSRPGATPGSTGLDAAGLGRAQRAGCSTTTRAPTRSRRTGRGGGDGGRAPTPARPGTLVVGAGRRSPTVALELRGPRQTVRTEPARRDRRPLHGDGAAARAGLVRRATGRCWRAPTSCTPSSTAAPSGRGADDARLPRGRSASSSQGRAASTPASSARGATAYGCGSSRPCATTSAARSPRCSCAWTTARCPRSAEQDGPAVAYYECYYGVSCTDSARAIQDELVRRGAPVRHVWGVADLSVPVPDRRGGGAAPQPRVVADARAGVAPDLQRRACPRAWSAAPARCSCRPGTARR